MKERPTGRVAVEERKPEAPARAGSFRDVLGAATRVVTRPLRTAAALITKPAEVFRRHAADKDADVSAPIRFALLGFATYLLSKAFFATPMDAIFDPLVWAGRDVGSITRSLWVYAAPVLLAPVSALQRRLFRNRGFSFAQTYAFGLYVLGEISLFRAAYIALNHFTGIGDVHTSTGSLIRDGIIIGIEALFVAWAATGFYRDRKPSVWVRGALSYGAFIALAYGIVAGIVWYAFRGLFG